MEVWVVWVSWWKWNFNLPMDVSEFSGKALHLSLALSLYLPPHSPCLL